MTIEIIIGISVSVLIVFFIVFCNSIKRDFFSLMDLNIWQRVDIQPSKFEPFVIVEPGKFSRQYCYLSATPCINYYLSKPFPQSQVNNIKSMLKHDKFIRWFVDSDDCQIRCTPNPVWFEDPETVRIADDLIHRVYKVLFEEPEDPCQECNGFCGECDDYINSPSKKAFEFNETDESEDDFETEEPC